MRANVSISIKTISKRQPLPSSKQQNIKVGHTIEIWNAITNEDTFNFLSEKKEKKQWRNDPNHHHSKTQLTVSHKRQPKEHRKILMKLQHIISKYNLRPEQNFPTRNCLDRCWYFSVFQPTSCIKLTGRLYTQRANVMAMGLSSRKPACEYQKTKTVLRVPGLVVKLRYYTSGLVTWLTRWLVALS